MRCEYCDNLIPDNISHCPCCGARVECEASGSILAQANEVSDATTSPRVLDPNLRGRSVEGAGRGWVKMQFDNVEDDPRLERESSGESRSRGTFVLLAIFFGVFGAHNFYAGYIKRGLIQLVMSICSFGALAIVVFAWAIIEAIAVRRDAGGQLFE